MKNYANLLETNAALATKLSLKLGAIPALRRVPHFFLNGLSTSLQTAMESTQGRSQGTSAPVLFVICLDYTDPALAFQIWSNYM